MATHLSAGNRWMKQQNKRSAVIISIYIAVWECTLKKQQWINVFTSFRIHWLSGLKCCTWWMMPERRFNKRVFTNSWIICNWMIPCHKLLRNFTKKKKKNNNSCMHIEKILYKCFWIGTQLLSLYRDVTVKRSSSENPSLRFWFSVCVYECMYVCVRTRTFLK